MSGFRDLLQRHPQFCEPSERGIPETDIRDDRLPTGLGRRLRRARRWRGLSQNKLAALADTSQAVVQKIENGKAVRTRIDEQLAKALDVPVEWLVYGVISVAKANTDSPVSLAATTGYRPRTR